MARRRSTSSRSTSSSSSGRSRGYRKSEDEARVERVTWGLLVLAFALFQLIPNSAGSSLPNWFIPVSGAVILLGSAVYQYTRRWHVSPITWIAGTVMLFFALYNFYVNPAMNFLGLALIVFVVVIIFGIITNET